MRLENKMGLFSRAPKNPGPPPQVRRPDLAGLIAGAPHDIMSSFRSHERELRFIEEQLAADEPIVAVTYCGLVTPGHNGVIVVTERRVVTAIRNDNNRASEPIVETLPLNGLSVQERPGPIKKFRSATLSSPGRDDLVLAFFGEDDWGDAFFSSFRHELNRSKFN